MPDAPSPDESSEAARAGEFLAHASIAPDGNRFSVGTFERGITIYRQQVRALNLIYAIILAGAARHTPIKTGSSIAIIGGGAFGATAAVAAATAGYEVYLYERQEVLLHLQRGCDTRWIHPHSYDWPEIGSASKLAQLPFLNWQAAKAADVVEMMQLQFDDVRNAPGMKLRVIMDVNNVEIGAEIAGGYRVMHRCREDQDIRRVDAVIYAVGFGVERVDNAAYWRNDELAQSAVDYHRGQKVPYAICGTGDGALVDLFRLRVRGFRQDQTLDDMFPPSDPDAALLRDRLGDLQERARSDAAANRVYDLFQELENGNDGAACAIKAGCDWLSPRLRSDTSVTLVSRNDFFDQGLDLRRISMANALLAYCLYRLGALDYSKLVIDIEREGIARVSSASPAAPKVIARIGTKRREALAAVGVTDLEIDGIEKRHKLNENGTGRPLYSVGWWGRYTMPNIVGSNRQPARVESVPQAMHVYSTTFVATLAAVLGSLATPAAASGKSAKFRVTLHRVVRLDDQAWLQQLTDYFGKVDDTEGTGRLFPPDQGIIGLACWTGRTAIVRRKEEAAFLEIWRKLDLSGSGARQIRDDVKNLMAWPLLAPLIDGKPRRTLMVLFVDSDNPDFMTPEHIDAVGAACRGYADLLDKLIGDKVVVARAGLERDGGGATTAEQDNLVQGLARDGVEFGEKAAEGTAFGRLAEADFDFGKLPLAVYRTRPTG